MENGKALHSGKNAEKRRLEALRKELLVLVHDFLSEEGLFEVADLLKEHLAPMLQQFRIADNIDLPLIATDFLAYYRLRFHRDPVLVKRCESVNETPTVNKNHRNRPSLTRKKKVREDGEESIDVKEGGPTILDKSSRNLRIPRHLLEDEKELFTIINREVLHQTEVTQELNMKDVIGLNEAKEALEDSFIFPLHHPEIYKNQLNGITGVLLTGPPGTGKTMIASALANLCKETVFFNVHASSLASKWRGDSEKLVRMLFELAVTNAPSIIFIDELEAILSERGCQGEHEASKRAKAEFLVHLEGLKSQFGRETGDKKPILFLASTNLPWTLDPAVLRRFQRIVNVKLPNKEEKMEIFKRCLRDVESSKIDVKLLCTKDTEYFSGRCIIDYPSKHGFDIFSFF